MSQPSVPEPLKSDRASVVMGRRQRAHPLVLAGIIILIVITAILFLAWDTLFPPAGEQQVAVSAAAEQGKNASVPSPWVTLGRHGDAISSVALSPDGRTVATGGGAQDPSIRFWDLPSGRPLGRLAGHSRNVKCAAYSPDGNYLLSCSADGTATYWDVQECRQVFSCARSAGEQWAVAVAPDGRNGITAGQEGVLHCWDLKTGQEQATLSGHEGLVQCVCFSPDGRQMLSVGNDCAVHLWDMERKVEAARFAGHRAALRTAAFSPDMKQIISGDDSGRVIVWDIAGRRSIRSITAHKNRVQSVEILPDGKRFLSASTDRAEQVRLWEIATGRELRRFSYPSGVNMMRLSPDGTQFVVGHVDGLLTLTHLPPELWSAQAKSAHQ